MSNMTKSSHYRPDIDGLRGIAVLCVLVFHAFPLLLPGGFIGADIFFVISGYLICGILLRDILDGRYSVAQFYARRIKRIFPALTLVLACTVAFGWLLLWPGEFQNLGNHVAGGAAFIANLLLWGNTGYFDETAEKQPLLHLWSLGIEEQFYMVFPIALWYATRLRLSITKFLAALLALSFIFSYYMTMTHPSVGFYFPVSRLWELLAGAVLAAFEQNVRQSTTAGPAGQVSSAGFLGVKSWAAYLGLACIAGSALFLTKNIPFPGVWAVLPVVGAVLVIAGGIQSSSRAGILSHKLLLWVGLISYPLYLWHWPLFYYSRLFHPFGLPTLWTFAVLFSSVLLAFLTFRLVETPIRFGRGKETRNIAGLSIVMAAIFLVGLLAKSGRFQPRLAGSVLAKEVGAAQKDRDYPFKDNYRLARGFHLDAEIVQGKPQGAILFIGDSHLQHYWPRIEQTLKTLQSQARPVLLITAPGSPGLPNIERLDKGYHCADFFDFAIHEAEKTNVSTVVFSSYLELYLVGNYPNHQPWEVYQSGDKAKTPLRMDSPRALAAFQEFGRVITRLISLGKEVIIIGSNPADSAFDPNAFHPGVFHSQVLGRASVPRQDFESYILPVKSQLINLAKCTGARFIDPLDYFDEDGRFYGMTRDGHFNYRDANHLRPFYVKDRAVFIDPLLAAPSQSPPP